MAPRQSGLKWPCRQPRMDGAVHGACAEVASPSCTGSLLLAGRTLKPSSNCQAAVAAASVGDKVVTQPTGGSVFRHSSSEPHFCSLSTMSKHDQASGLSSFSILVAVLGLSTLLGHAIASREEESNNGQVSINQPSAWPETEVPITATLFVGAQGPKSCRGSPMLSLSLPSPGSLHPTPVGYDLPEPASCAVFMATKQDGCETRLFADKGCGTFVNLAVFLPEYRAVGGFFRSLSIRCGVESVEPPPLRPSGPWDRARAAASGGRMSDF